MIKNKVIKANLRAINLNLQMIHHYGAIFEAVNPIALRKAKIVYNFGLSECNRIKEYNR